MASIVIESELGSEFDIGNIQTGKIRLKLGNGLTIAPDGTISASLGTIPTTNVTEVLRTIINIGTDPNTNTNTAPDQIELLGFELDEIGVSLGINEFKLPRGNYEIQYQINLDSNGVRTNFYILLREGINEIDRNYHSFYARNASNHDDTGSSSFFTLTNYTPNDPLNLATLREANGGDVDLVGGKIIIKRFEQKTALSL